ncbi:chitin-binding domain protein cbd-1 isoform X1 [Nilaparvata lugens]|uniref:chitin-binding domain protein cbd-1 isoform X1 n=2 Tax=Nilaparvata lugens TaxID=108931 RepID=UPI00193CD7C1|nr:chitin-binding domain protein cbd-1 isoform X1 [Nilaparvata lugens]
MEMTCDHSTGIKSTTILVVFYSITFIVLGLTGLTNSSPLSNRNSTSVHLLKESPRCESGMEFNIGEDACKPVEEVTPLQVKCSLSSNELFVTPGSRCRTYYSCKNGTKISYTCPVGQLFDKEKQACSSNAKTCYELVCAGRVNGEYTDTTHDCKRYFRCEGGELTSIGHCAQGQRFNGADCVNASAVGCGSSKDMAVGLSARLEDRCTGYDDGVYSAADISCKQYFLCKSEKTLVQLECPQGQRFDGQKCMAAELVPCYSYCTGRKDGYHANLKKECREFVRCMNEQTIQEKSCSPGTIFNGEMCVPKDIYTCPSFNENMKSYDRCETLNNGFHTNYLTSCTDYFECFNGITLHYHTCKDGRWNGHQCVPSQDFFCSPPEESPVCSSRGDGLYADESPASRCKKYYYCTKGKQIRMKCEDGKVFDGIACVSEDLYKCPIKETECSGDGEGYYMDLASGCRAYYYCLNGDKISYVCPDNQVFNGVECVESSAFSCPSNFSDAAVCEAAVNGYFADMSNNCEKYFYCVDGRKVMTFSCPEGERFDGYQCSKWQQTACHKTLQLPCRFLKDGYYIQPDSECQNYFRCSNRKMVEIHTCLDGYSFNGDACVPIPLISCHKTMLQQNENLNTCKKHNDGFFPDLQSGCQNYFYCINGEKSALKCPNNKLFNGEVCVDEKTFLCPRYTVAEQTIDDLQTQ